MSLYLDIYRNGKREYEFLKLYLLPELTKADKKKNDETMKLQAIASPLSTTKSIAPPTLTSSIANRWKRWAQTMPSYNSGILMLFPKHSA
jgi:hypothetical protein